MKKIFLIGVLLATFGIAQAQLRDVKNYTSVTKTDAAGADTILITPNAYETVVFHTLTDSCHYKLKSTGKSVKGDRVMFVITNTAGGTKFKTIPASGFEITGADSVLTITASKRATQEFIFDGTKFIQTSKIVQ